MERLTLQNIADYAGGKIRQGIASRAIAGVVTDSRSVFADELFLALVGEKFDGHQFVSQVEQAGAAGAIIARTTNTSNIFSRFALIEVDDTLLGYQRLAAAYRQTLPLHVIAITGSNGKTSAKDFTAAVLGQNFRVLKTEGNHNNHIGVPRTLLRAGRDDEVAVLEMGMNHPGEIAPLAAMAKPDMAIITNIGTAHIEYMGSREAIAEEKGMLVEAVGVGGNVILPAEDPFMPALTQRTAAKIWTAGLHKGEIRAENIRASLAGSEFDLLYAGNRIKASVKVLGEHMIVNALLAVGAGLASGMSLEDVARGLSSATLTSGRLELRRVRDLQIIDDSYNANPDSMVAALVTLASLPTERRRIAVLGRMGELGMCSEAGHRRVGEAAASNQIDCVITVGDEAALIARTAEAAGVTRTHLADDTQDAARFLEEFAEAGDLILVKGSRSAGMERVIADLENRSANAVPAIHMTTH